MHVSAEKLTNEERAQAPVHAPGLALWGLGFGVNDLGFMV